jgi:hypothetical protein
MQSMSDDTELVNYFTDYGVKRFCGRAGEPPSHRLLVKNIKLFDGLVAKVGHTSLICPKLADARLLELAAAQRQQRQERQLQPPQPEPEQPRRPGREAAQIEIPQPARRGRGRPPGSRNRPKPPPEDAPNLDGPNEPVEPVKDGVELL